VDETIRTSICNLKVFRVTFFFYRSINCNSSFSYSPGGPACPTLFGTVYFIAAPHHGLFKGKAGLRIRSRKLGGSAGSGSGALAVGSSSREGVRVLSSPGQNQGTAAVGVNLLFGG